MKSEFFDVTIGIHSSSSAVRHTLWGKGVCIEKGLSSNFLTFNDATALVEHIINIKSKILETRSILVRIIMADQIEALDVVRSARKLLEAHVVPAVLCMELTRKSSVTDTLILSSDQNSVTLQNKLASIQEKKLRGVRIVSQVLPLCLPERLSSLWVRTGGADLPPVEDLEFADLASLKEILVFCHDQKDISALLPRNALKNILTTNIPKFTAFQDDCRPAACRPFSNKISRNLFVFPERMLPIKRAFFSRGFDLISALNYNGIHTDMLLFGPNNADLKRIQTTLQLVAPRVFAFPLERGHLPALDEAVRECERLIRRRLGHHSAPPMRFTEREHVFTASAQRKHLAHVLTESGPYERVVLTGAWFMKAAAELRRYHPAVRWACDTHDAFFILDADANRDEKRILYSASRQKTREINALNSADLIVAISQSDASNFKAAGLVSKVVVDSGTFEQALVDLRDGDPVAGRFGFIGSSNSLNQRALRKIRDDWWPRILADQPGAVLAVAGAICDTDIARTLSNDFPGSIQLKGFVGNVKDFYREVAIMLSPIMAQGGLNFKSVEALMAGRHLITNRLGAACLGSLPGIFIAEDDAGSLENALTVIRTQDSRACRAVIQAAARSRFGETSGYKNLVGWLSPTAADTAAPQIPTLETA